MLSVQEAALFLGRLYVRLVGPLLVFEGFGAIWALELKVADYLMVLHVSV